MKIKALAIMIFASFTCVIGQPVLPQMDLNPRALDQLGLDSSQKDKVNAILVQKEKRITQLRHEAAMVMERLRDSSRFISDEAEKELFSVLNKEQAEQYKAGISQQEQFAFMPPMGRPMDDYPSNPPEIRMPFPCPPLQYGPPDPDESEAKEPDHDYPDDINYLREMDILDLMNIL